MYNRNTILAVAVIVMIPVAVILAPIPEAKAQFVLSSWSYPDEYGQGINYFTAYTNESGGWPLWRTISYVDTSNFEIPIGSAIRLMVHCWLNSTLVGASSLADGKNYIQHSAIVELGNGTVIFNLQNFTYNGGDAGINPPLYYYEYYVILDFISEAGLIYTVTITQEVFW